jgi:hypothetical protein
MIRSVDSNTAVYPRKERKKTVCCSYKERRVDLVWKKLAHTRDYCQDIHTRTQTANYYSKRKRTTDNRINHRTERSAHFLSMSERERENEERMRYV